MRFSRRDKLALVVFAVVFAFLGWRVHDRGLLRWGVDTQSNTATRLAQQPLLVTSLPPASATAVKGRPKWVPLADLPRGQEPSFKDREVTNRLRNTAAAVAELLRRDSAILLRNALIDTASGEPLAIPAKLRSSQPAEAYVIQARGPITPAFRERLNQAGATVLSYVPNNALLVQASADVADQLAMAPETAGIMPLEPYFKLTPGLLALALADAPLPDGLRLILTVPEAPATVPELTALGVREVFRERGPFGTLLTVEAPANSLIPLAGLPSVHRVEPKRGVRFANDITAFSLGSTTTPENTNSFEELDGSGVLVNVNDSGVDATQPQLEGRVFTLPSEPQVLLDPNGHGTHVAGIIASDGTDSDTINNPPPQGSVTNANFKGKAPKASLYVLPVDLLFGPPSGDSFLQETAANAPQRFNSREDVLISNNSWGYIGLDEFEYTSHSASYDAAVRDSLPRTPGDQPILYVFSAGNAGFGGNNGGGGAPDTISSPGNAKNVVTVGALESRRDLTNAVVLGTNQEPVQIGAIVIKPGWETNPGPYITNRLLLPFTDSESQVAFYSSRGNVGIGIEGPVGRFKPDVVAPGSFIASTRSLQWEPPPLPPPDDPSFPGAVLFDEANAQLLPWYRYELGTSMSAPAISGLLAQLQQYFEQKANQFPSAAAYKGLLINSARETSESYLPNQDQVINYAGWGKPNLRRALGRGFKGKLPDNSEVDVIGLDSSSGITTGQSLDVSLNITLTNALDYPLRLVLAWTDPPGDPLVGPKLVNDLDLIVSNTVTGEIFWGNDFALQTPYSRAHNTNEVKTNGYPNLDRINNVERIVLPAPLSSNYVITVVGSRVNVNSRRDAPSAIVQDFALLFSSDIGETNTDSVGVLDFPTDLNPIALAFERPPVLVITNGFALLNQRVGANSPLLGGTNGQLKQWQFYTFTNSPIAVTNLNVLTTNGTPLVTTNGSNVAFITFPFGNLSRGRTNGPDVDLYVSRLPGLTNLNPAVIASARKSTSRGGNELVYFTGEAVSDDNIFYVGVKSEDHQAGEYGFVGISTDQPLTFTDENGNLRPLTIPLLQPIPDGSPADPGVGLYLAVSIASEEIRSVIPSVTLRHQNFPDLLDQLAFRGRNVVLQNHTQLLGQDHGTNLTVVYDDTGSGLPGAIPSDGPGSLIDFLGESSQGAWFLSTVDNAMGNVGSIDNFSLSILPNDLGDDFVLRCVRGGFIGLEVINVPPEASRLTITITNIDPAVPLEVFINRDRLPDILDPANNDKYAQIPASGGSVSLGIRDVPPLEAGRYFVAVYNPNSVLVCYRIRARLERNLDESFTKTFTSDQLGPIPDAARRFSTIQVDDPRRVTAMDVGLRIDHPRVSDLVLRLENPRGYSAVLFEDRGETVGTNLGTTVITTNLTYQHVALSFDPGTSRADLYINGALVAERLMPLGFIPATSNQFYFAQDPSDWELNQGIKIDDFGLWRRALRPDQIRDIYLRGLDGEPKHPTDRNAGLMALWPFNGNGAEIIGNNNASLTWLWQPVPGAFPNELAVYFPSLAYGIVTNRNVLPIGTGFTMEGWISVPAPATNAVVAGWWNEGTAEAEAQFGPALVTGGAAGNGSVTAIMTDVGGQRIAFSTPAGALFVGRPVTNTLFATFSDNTNRANELIKFVPPPFSGQLEEGKVLSVDDFERVEARAYDPGTTFQGWEVFSNLVAVIEDSALAYQGSKFLALSNGVARRTFNAAVGDRYAINFAARLAPGETNVFTPVVLVDGVAVAPPLILSESDWNTNFTVEVRATKPTVVIEFSGVGTPAGSPGMLLDDVTYIQTKGTVSYFSEEPTRPLLGAGLGTWSLELNDTRTPFVGDLLAWQLTLTFAPTSAPAIRLTNGVPFITNAIGASPQYFYIDIPLEATTTTNLLQSVTGGPLALWYNPIGIPGEGALPEDFPLILPTVGNFVMARPINTNVPPILIPGQRYYLSVVNLDPAQSNLFAIEVDLGIKITPLTNAVPVAATNLNTGMLDYYSFQVSTNALGVTFVVTNLSDNVQLVARKGPQLPTRTQFDYASTNPGVVPEVIFIDQSSQPVPLSPGTWYLGVYSASTNLSPPIPITYTIEATEVLGLVTSLTNGVPFNGTITNSTGIAYFYLDIDQDPLVATFAVSNLTANANLYLRRGLPLPSTNSFDFASTNAGSSDEEIIVAPGSQPIPLTMGRWYLAVVAVDPLPVNFTVFASYVPNTVTIIQLEDSVPFPYFDAPPTNSQFFSFHVNPGVNAVLFEIYGLTGDADLLASYAILPPYASTNNLYSAPRTGNLSERIALRSNTVTNLSGTWYLQVAVTSTNAIDFTVRAATQQDGLLLSGEPLAATYIPGDPPTLQFDAVPGEVYATECAFDLSTDPILWITVDVAPAAGETAIVTLPPLGPTDTQRYYRVTQLPQ
ncbi:MAG TPA: S8 family serine peptidase [Verrucomicrobiota bacterium]|nr:hypothetical protein [Verrucomicrobiales bacterium]HRI13783.1 S8 family serine peptidase [Verrucomicrobiota bacterium]